ncbi:hypothetical protein C8Q75DRAFT_810990 [Abortiporus biennis]|nr:hypothetical protein C8Q75DRAFT_810990 [Abortiporus biennis]
MVPSFANWSQSAPLPVDSISEHLVEIKDKPKKPRHRHSALQLAALNELYDKNEHPPLEDRTSLAERLGMEVKTVNAWFQNKRASSKKRHKGAAAAAAASATPQYELPPISALIASVSAPSAPHLSEYDELSEDESLHSLAERHRQRIPSHSRQRQSNFYPTGPQHTHLFEADQSLPKKGRSRPTQAQTEELRKLYDRNPHPSKEEREALGDRIGMRYQSVTNWFQNQRSIAKKKKDEEDAQFSSTRSYEPDRSSSSSRTYSPFPPSSSAVHPSLSVPPATGHPSLPSLAIPPHFQRSVSGTPLSSTLDSRPSSPRASPYAAAAAERASSVANSRARRSRPEPYQLDALKKLFHRTQTPSIEERGALALEINMDVGKVTNWFRNLRQTARKRTRKTDGDDDDDDDVSLATYTAFSRDVSRAGSPVNSASASSSTSPRLQDDGDIAMDDANDHEYPRRHAEYLDVKVEQEDKHNSMYSHAPFSRSHSDMGSDEDDQEAVTPSPSPPPPAFAPAVSQPKRSPSDSQTPNEYSLAAVDPLTYAEMEKATAKYQTGVKVEDALLLLSFHHHVVR